MFMPIQSFDSTTPSSNVDQTDGIVLTLQADGHSVTVTRDGFSIGSSKNCDLTLNEPEIPALHSLIRIQSGAIWIEAANDTILLFVNDRPYRRMALRHDDRIRIGSTDFSVHFGSESNAAPEQSDALLTEDLSLLTA
jgi:predicted component of type VI protein secretion system